MPMRAKLALRRVRTEARFRGADPWNGDVPADLSIEAYYLVPEHVREVPSPCPWGDTPVYALRSGTDGAERFLPDALGHLWKTGKVAAEALPGLLREMEPDLAQSDFQPVLGAPPGAAGDGRPGPAPDRDGGGAADLAPGGREPPLAGAALRRGVGGGDPRSAAHLSALLRPVGAPAPADRLGDRTLSGRPRGTGEGNPYRIRYSPITAYLERSPHEGNAVKKLALSRETLRRLSDQTLRQAAGGVNTVTPSCRWSDCETCGIICSAPIQTCACPVE